MSYEAALPTLVTVLSWAGVWILHLCVLVTYPVVDPRPGGCAPALLRAAARAGWICAAARLSGGGPPAGMAAMALAVALAPSLGHCVSLDLHAAASKGYPAGCACAGLAALLAAFRAARRGTPVAGTGDGASAAASWHPLGPATSS
jgi:hypothetical protein